MSNFPRPSERRLAARVFSGFVASLILGFGVPAFAVIGTPTNIKGDDAVEARVDKLLSQLTQSEKIALLSGEADQMHIPGVARLGIPELKFSDGPVGVRCWGKSTAYPCGAMLASTFDVDAATAIGKALGRDSRARAVHILLGPGVNVYRQAQNGRNFEYFGEDPFLSARLARSWVQAVQDQGVAVSVKHFAANDQETLRESVNTLVDERRLHEICLPPFKAAVQDSNAWTVMAAYNKVNGYWCTANKVLLSDILRDRWGFKGVLMSDWGAVHEAPGPLTAGTDLEMGKTTHYTEANINSLLKEGQVTQAQIDDHVRRVLRMEAALGFLDRQQLDSSIPLNDPLSAQTALRVAREGLVLLRNNDNVLPLARTKVHKLVVLGPNACPAVTGGGGSSLTDPFTSVSLFDAIKTGAGKAATVSYIPSPIGIDAKAITADSFNSQGYYEPIGENGLRGVRGEYYANPDFTGTPAATRDDAHIDYVHSEWNEHPDAAVTTSTYSMRWTGKITAPQTDEYMFVLSSDGGRVKLDGKTLLEADDQSHVSNVSKTIALKGGETHDLLVEYRHNNPGQATVQFVWGKQNPEMTTEETKQIEQADAVIASVGFNRCTEHEGADRSYDLPADQVKLIQSAAKINPRTIVVLNAGGNVGMSNWIDRVAALIHAWYPGQNGNTAVAEAIFGDINPSGRLPDTFEAKWEDSPSYNSFPGDAKNGGTVKYTEGIYSGYRWYDKKNIAPRFPFGYGLSYTTFSVDNLKVSPSGSNMTVSVDVKNTGRRAGATVVQLYVRPQDSAVDRPVQELKGFVRAQLNPGEKRTVVMPLDHSSFALWNTAKHDWVSPAGKYEIAVGQSSRDLACRQSIEWKQ
ncbi:MAG TPA: glycoside hydrolase family 3 C-terminal domain-containing protein [Candidatus Obscuribacterales bacterium]